LAVLSDSTNHDKATLGGVVRQRRRELGLTQEELAERIGGNVRQSDISRLERGGIGLPRRDRLEAIAAALDVTPGFLLLRSNWFGEAESAEKPAGFRETDDHSDTPEAEATDLDVTVETTSLPATSDLRAAISRAYEVSRRTSELIQASSQALSGRRLRESGEPE